MLSAIRAITMKRWNDNEISILKELYGKIDISVLSKKINRSIDAIHWKASSLNIEFKQNDYLFLLRKIELLDKKVDDLFFKIELMTKHKLNWSEEEIEFLKKNKDMTVKYLSVELKRTPKSVTSCLNRLGIKQVFKVKKTVLSEKMNK